MKKILKVVSLVVALMLFASMFAGCGTDTSDKNEKGQTVISVGGWPSKEGTSLDNMNAKKERFEQANPDVEIDPDLWNFERKTFYAKAAGGQLPIVYNAGFTEINEIMESEYAAEVSDILKKYDYMDKINPKVLEVISKENGIYAIPKSVSIMGLMFNAELYDAAGLIGEDGMPKQPKDWYEVVEFAKKIKEATGKAGFVMPTSGNSGGWLFTNIAWSFGVNFIVKDENGNWKANFDTPEAVEALQFIKDMKWKHNILPDNTLIDASEWMKLFGVGNAGITFAAGDYPANLLPQYGMMPNNLGFLAMPAGPKSHVTLLAGDIICIGETATKDQKDAAMRWIATDVNYQVSDELKHNITEKYSSYAENNRIVGVHGISVWNSEVEAVKFEREIIDQKINTNPNYVKLYNDFTANCPAEIRAEEPVCTQELYATLDSCLQEVLTNKDVDCATVLKNANADFQANYLNNL